MKKTPLNPIHKQLGARMVEFGGWEMPVEYSGLIEEHLAVRKEAGLFDVSHMGEIEIRGPRALDLVQKVTCNDAARLTPGRSQYSALLTSEGTFVDDIMVYCLKPDHYLLCVNASNIEKDFRWIMEHPLPDAVAENSSNRWGLIALQGPLARKILPSSLKKNHFQETKLFDQTILLSGTGYTGEDGFEFFCNAESSPVIWNHLLEIGRPHGLVPCGLGARDTLRLEASYPLYGHEIDESTTPFEAGLDWIVKMEKGVEPHHEDFIGREALARRSPTKRLVGLKLTEPGIARQGYKIFLEGQEAGFVTSGSLSPLTREAIAMGTLKLPLTKETLPGKKIEVDIRGRKRQAVLVPLPFYRGAKK